MVTQDLLNRYVEKGFSIIPVHYQSKSPAVPGWQNLRITTENVDWYFNSGRDWNIGVLMGQPSGGLVDLDLDCDESLPAARTFCPPTAMFGYQSRPRSHYIYRCVDIHTITKYENNGKILEVRGAGQTVFPGSMHVCGERIGFEPGCPKIQDIDSASLLYAAGMTARCALLARCWC